jgi:hypothetical protein
VSSGNIIQVTPFMLVPDLDSALAFLTGTLGFTIGIREASYAYVTLGGASMRISRPGPAIRSSRARAASLIISTAATSTDSMRS